MHIVALDAQVYRTVDSSRRNEERPGRGREQGKLQLGRIQKGCLGILMRRGRGRGGGKDGVGGNATTNIYWNIMYETLHFEFLEVILSQDPNQHVNNP